MKQRFLKAHTWVILITVTFISWIWTVVVGAQDPVPTVTPPPGLTEALAELSLGIDLVKDGLWIGGIVAFIKVVWWGIDKLPEKWQTGIKSNGIQVNVILGAIGTILAVVAGGASWADSRNC